MDPQRVEEFRRKLREGRPVRVRNGQVLFEEGRPSAEKSSGTKSVASAANESPPAQQGVVVKPHEWGSEAFYQTESGMARALAEQALLSREYPGFALEVDEDGTPYAHGQLGPTAQIRGCYHILIALPPRYGQGALPAVHVLEPPLRAGAPHRYQDGSLCLDHSGSFNRRSTLLTLLGWVTVWLLLYEGWLETGVAW